jgi:hypothetical protein
MKRLLVLFAALLVFACANVAAVEERDYTEGAVSVVTSVKIKDGQFDNYMAYLRKTYKPIMEEQKKAGIILDYAVYNASPRTPDDADLYLVVVYPNMASFDGLDDRSEPIMTKVSGQNRAQANSASAARTSMREITGSEMVRELKLK